MLVWEVHKALAAAINDPIEIDITTGAIPDGVRYSRFLRSSYIDRAILHILSSHLKQAIGQNENDQGTIIYGLYPTFTRTNTIVPFAYTSNAEYTYPLPASFVTAENNAPVYVLDASYLYEIPPVVPGQPVTTTREQLPIVSTLNFNEIVSRKYHATHYADSIATYYGSSNGLRIYNSKNIDITNPPSKIEINYLPYPTPIEQLNWDDPVDFEHMYLSVALVKAALYAANDSGEINEQIMAQSVLPMIGQL